MCTYKFHVTSGINLLEKYYAKRNLPKPYNVWPRGVFKLGCRVGGAGGVVQGMVSDWPQLVADW